MKNRGIYQAITNAMGEISPIAKRKRNKEQGFQYRGVDDVMNELSPVLVKHKIFIYPEVINVQRQERTTNKGGTLLYSVLTVKYHFAHEDGSELSCVVIGEGMDSGDKASNKAMAVAFKYACLQMFCIPTDDMDDPDKNTPPPSIGNRQYPADKAANGTHGSQSGEPDQATIINGIKEILFAADGEHSCFNETEINAKKEIVGKAKNIQELKSELAKKKAAKHEDSPSPVNDSKFVDDIPF